MLHKTYKVKSSQGIKEVFNNDFNIMKYNREKLGYSPVDISKKTNYNLRTIQRIERMKLDGGPTDISLQSLLTYLDAVGLELRIARKKKC